MSQFESDIQTLRLSIAQALQTFCTVPRTPTATDAEVGAHRVALNFVTKLNGLIEARELIIRRFRDELIEAELAELLTKIGPEAKGKIAGGQHTLAGLVAEASRAIPRGQPYAGAVVIPKGHPLYKEHKALTEAITAHLDTLTPAILRVLATLGVQTVRGGGFGGFNPDYTGHFGGGAGAPAPYGQPQPGGVYYPGGGHGAFGQPLPFGNPPPNPKFMMGVASAPGGAVLPAEQWGMLFKSIMYNPDHSFTVYVRTATEKSTHVLIVSQMPGLEVTLQTVASGATDTPSIAQVPYDNILRVVVYSDDSLIIFVNDITFEDAPIPG